MRTFRQLVVEPAGTRYIVARYVNGRREGQVLSPTSLFAASNYVDCHQVNENPQSDANVTIKETP